MKKVYSLLLIICILSGFCGCGGASESKELKRIKGVAFSYTYTKEDRDLLKKKINDDEVQKWLSEEAVKIGKGEYDSTSVSSFLNFLEESDVEHPETIAQSRVFYSDLMKEKKDAAFSDSDPMAVFRYAMEAQEMEKRVPPEDVLSYLTHRELSEHIRKTGTLTISGNNMGGYYDSLMSQYENSYVTDESMATKNLSYFFSGDFMLRAFSKKEYRPTGAQWEEIMLKKYDFNSFTYRYKETEVFITSEMFEKLDEGEVYVYPEEDTYLVFVIMDDRIVANSKEIQFDFDYGNE